MTGSRWNLRDEEPAFLKQANDFHVCPSFLNIKVRNPVTMHRENLFDREIDVLDFHFGRRYLRCSQFLENNTE